MAAQAGGHPGASARAVRPAARDRRRNQQGPNRERLSAPLERADDDRQSARGPIRRAVPAREPRPLDARGPRTCARAARSTAPIRGWAAGRSAGSSSSPRTATAHGSPCSSSSRRICRRADTRARGRAVRARSVSSRSGSTGHAGATPTVSRSGVVRQARIRELSLVTFAAYPSATAELAAYLTGIPPGRARGRSWLAARAPNGGNAPDGPGTSTSPPLVRRGPSAHSRRPPGLLSPGGPPRDS